VGFALTLGSIRMGATNVVWKVNAKITQSQVRADHKSPLGVS
jgi:hypothetical protein